MKQSSSSQSFAPDVVRRPQGEGSRVAVTARSWGSLSRVAISVPFLTVAQAAGHRDVAEQRRIASDRIMGTVLTTVGQWLTDPRMVQRGRALLASAELSVLRTDWDRQLAARPSDLPPARVFGTLRPGLTGGWGQDT